MHIKCERSFTRGNDRSHFMLNFALILSVIESSFSKLTVDFSQNGDFDRYFA